MSKGVSVVHEHCESDRSLSLKQPAAELRDKLDSGIMSSEPAKHEHDTVENMQKKSAEARTIQSGFEIAKKSSFTGESDCGSQRPHNLDNDLVRVLTEPTEQKQEIDAENRGECGALEPPLVRNELRTFSEDVTRISPSKQVSPSLEGLKVKSTSDYMAVQQDSMPANSVHDHLEPQILNESENPIIEHLELNVKETIENASSAGLGVKETSLRLEESEDLGFLPEREGSSSHCDESEYPSAGLLECSERAAVEAPRLSRLRDKETPAQSSKRIKSTSGPLVTCTRVLRSRSQEKPKMPEPNNMEAKVTVDNVNRMKRRKKMQMKKNPKNEYSRIRSHLRYLLHRIKYEQNLIEAYSTEGWKGQSLEKIKPEKELQRAKSHILCYKVKIRDLFQHLDLSIAEGRFPESLFDSNGEIDSEDIFCAKCGSKDLTDDNDIILCDGACERGFHQFCLEPPLLKEEIPPDDEGWLCPGCDCKVDCIDMLNDFHGTNLSFLDNWEKVFPEAAAATASGKTPADYNPDKPELGEKVQGDKTSSDESGYFSAHDDLAAFASGERYLGFPSEDSEDDDYDPSYNPDHDVHIKQESSTSDFTSNSEDLGAVCDDNTSLDEERGQTSLDGGKLEANRAKRQSLRDELSYLLDSNAAPVSGKRHVERLDYEKIYDEMYGNLSTDSSDEDFEETAGWKRRKSNSGNMGPTSPKKPPERENGRDVMPENHNQKRSKNTSKRTPKKLDSEGKYNLSTSDKSSLEARSSVKSTGRQYKRLQKQVTQRLLESFKENQYPERPVKWKLAEELGLTIKQVNKWFQNARWSFRHSASTASNDGSGEHSS